MANQNNRQFDLVAIDCDGTLLDSQKNVSKGAREAVDKARAAGIQIVPISGRNVDSLKFATDELNLNDLVVGCDGAFIYDSSAGKVLDIHTLPTERARELIRLCRKLDVILFFDYVDYAVYEKSTPEMERLNHLHEYNRKRLPDMLNMFAEGPVKAMVICSEIATLNSVVAEIHRQHLFDNVIFAASNSIDILPEGVNKGTGLKLLSKIKSIPLERIAVVGDWLNDLSMFQVGGFSVAMGNAPDELKAQADLVAPTNDEGGAAWAIEQILNR